MLCLLEVLTLLEMLTPRNSTRNEAYSFPVSLSLNKRMEIRKPNLLASTVAQTLLLCNYSFTVAFYISEKVCPQGGPQGACCKLKSCCK